LVAEVTAERVAPRRCRRALGKLADADTDRRRPAQLAHAERLELGQARVGLDGDDAVDVVAVRRAALLATVLPPLLRQIGAEPTEVAKVGHALAAVRLALTRVTLGERVRNLGDTQVGSAHGDLHQDLEPLRTQSVRVDGVPTEQEEP